jgi:hypothetical protein
LIDTKEIDENVRMECLFALLTLIGLNSFSNGGLQGKARLKMNKKF